MERTPEKQEENQERYFETYEVKNSDLEYLLQGIDTLGESALLEEGILDDIRFVTYDSKYLYVCTKGEHASTDVFRVEEIPSLSKTGFRIFKVEHSGFIGRNRRNYRGARAGLLCDEIEKTAVNAKKFPNQFALYNPEHPQPKEILDVVSMAPFEPYHKIHQEKFDYLTNVIFHEAGHIEKRHLENWQEGEEQIDAFPSQEQKEKFISVIRQTKIFPEEMINFIIENITYKAINEMYPMLIDQEGARRYNQEQVNQTEKDFHRTFADIQNALADRQFMEHFKEILESGHTIGRLLVRILEEQISDFKERKAFVRLILTRNHKKAVM